MTTEFQGDPPYQYRGFSIYPCYAPSYGRWKFWHHSIKLRIMDSVNFAHTLDDAKVWIDTYWNIKDEEEREEAMNNGPFGVGA